MIIGFFIGVGLAVALIALAVLMLAITHSFVVGALTYFAGAVVLFWLLRRVQRKLRDELVDSLNPQR